MPSAQSNRSRSPPRRTSVRRGRPLRGRHRARGAEEDEVEVHARDSTRHCRLAADGRVDAGRAPGGAGGQGERRRHAVHAVGRPRDADLRGLPRSRACACSTSATSRPPRTRPRPGAGCNRACGVALVTAGPGVTGTRHRGRELHRRADAARRDRRRAPARPGGARARCRSSTSSRSSGRSRSGPRSARTPERIPDFVATAFRHALAQPRGPVYLELPMDVLFARRRRRSARPRPSRSEARAVRRPERDDEGRRPAHERRAAGGDRRQRHLVGRRVEAARRVRRERPAARLPPGLRARRAAARPRARSSSTHARGRRARGADVVCVIGTPLDFRLRFGRLHAGREARPRPRRPDRARPQPRARRGDRRRLRRRARHPRRRRQEPPRRPSDVARAPARGRGGLVGRAPRARSSPTAAPIHHYRLGAELDAVLDPGHDRDRRRRRRRRGRLARAARPPARALARPGAVRLPRRRPALRARRQGGRARTRRSSCRRRRRLRPERLRVRDADALRAAGRVRDRQRRRLGRDPDPAGRDLRRGRARSRRCSRRPATTCSRRPSAATASTSSGPRSSRPRSSARSPSGEPAIVNVMLDPHAMAGHAYRGM